MTYDVIKLNRFPNSPEVMLFFQPTYVSLLPKFSFKHWWMWNGNFKLCYISVFDWTVLSNEQHIIAFFISAPASRPLPPPVLSGSHPPVPLHLSRRHEKGGRAYKCNLWSAQRFKRDSPKSEISARLETVSMFAQVYLCPSFHSKWKINLSSQHQNLT